MWCVLFSKGSYVIGRYLKIGILFLFNSSGSTSTSTFSFAGDTIRFFLSVPIQCLVFRPDAAFGADL